MGTVGDKAKKKRATIGKLSQGHMIISKISYDYKVVNEKLLCIWGYINNKCLLAIFDTGANNNLIAGEVAKSLGLALRDCLAITVALTNSTALGCS